MKKIILVIILLCYQINFADDKVIVSPGVKLGYAFGEKGGFVFGFEVSLVSGYDTIDHNRFYGAVLSFEKMKNEYRLHIGAQMNIPDKEGV